MVCYTKQYGLKATGTGYGFKFRGLRAKTILEGKEISNV